MYYVKDLISFSETNNHYFGNNYNYLVEWTFNEYIKGHNINAFLSDFSESSKILLLSDIYRNHDLLEHDFGDSFLKSSVSSISYLISKFERFHLLKNHKVYCDESMNIRKALLRSDVNYELKDLCFVLGGIIVPDEVDLNDIKGLFRKNTDNEFKYKFFSYGYSMPDCLKSDRFGTLFDFIIKNNIKIHFNVENYFFYSLVDILDSISSFGSKENSLLYKSAFYTYLIKAFDETYKLLIKFEYPSIPLGKEKEFIGELLKIFERSIKNSDVSNSTILFFGNSLLSILKEKDINELALVQNNKPYVLEESLINAYIQTSSIFMWNGVLFDHEKKIESELEEMDETYCETLNCNFEESQKEIGIQISDAISGFVARLLKYINENMSNNSEEIIETIKKDERMFSNIKKFYKIYSYSSDYYKYGICMKMSLFEKETFDFLMQEFYS